MRIESPLVVCFEKKLASKMSRSHFLVKRTENSAKRVSTEERLRISRNNLTKFLVRVEHLRFILEKKYFSEPSTRKQR